MQKTGMEGNGPHILPPDDVAAKDAGGISDAEDRAFIEAASQYEATRDLAQTWRNRGLSGRAANVLAALGIATVEQAKKLTTHKLKTIPKIAYRTIREIEDIAQGRIDDKHKESHEMATILRSRGWVCKPPEV